MSYQVLWLAPVFLAWPGCFWLCRELAARKKIHNDWRVSWMLACAGWGALLTWIVELSSLAHQFAAPTVAIAWLIASGMLLGGAGRLAWQRGMRPGAAWRDWSARWNEDWARSWPLDAKIMTAGTGVLALALGIAAAITPTTNFDSLTYHLPRVMHWMQQQSVDHYATANTRQLEFGPWSAFAVATLYLLQGNDGLANLVQWFAMVTCLIVVSLIAELLMDGHGMAPAGHEQSRSRLGGRRRAAALAALLTVTVPIGVVESITTQTDCVVACWCACLAGLLLALRKQASNGWYAAGAGLALALGILTKATMLILAAPIGLAVAVWLWARRREPRWCCRMALIFAVTFLAINTPHFLRNFAVFGSPLGSRHIFAIERNGKISVAATLSNVIRNLALNTDTGIEPLTKALNATLMRLHSLTGLDLNDPATTFEIGRFRLAENFFITDSYASNFYHLALALVAVVAGLTRRAVATGPESGKGFESEGKGRALVFMVYPWLIVTSFLMFCAYVRWQQWHSRVHLSYLVLLMPWVAAVLVCRGRTWWSWLGAAWVFGFSMICLLKNESRPLFDRNFMTLPRELQYLKVYEQKLLFNGPLVQAAQDVAASRCPGIGLRLGFYDAEYPLWIFLRNRGFAGRLDHVLVENESAKIRSSAPRPCAIMTSATNLVIEPANAFPYRTVYGPLTVLWSEAASHWADVSAFDPINGSLEPLADVPGGLRFNHGLITLYLRVPRQGHLHLRGTVTGSDGTGVRGNALRIYTYVGAEQTQELNGQPVELEMPLGAGTSVVRLGLKGPLPGDIAPAHLKEIQWRWKPEGAN
jgi:4-amino-4-deoxy-L-arabinose transferase-like glycosyltransferase